MADDTLTDDELDWLTDYMRLANYPLTVTALRELRAARTRLAAVKKVCDDAEAWCANERFDVPPWVRTVRRAAAGRTEPADPEPPTPTRVRVDNREPECVEAWPGCHDGGYDPRCCRFPKSCMVEGRIEWVTEPADTGEHR